MSFFPYQEYSLHSSVDANEVKQKIRASIEPVQNIRNILAGDYTRPFEGSMKIDTFIIQRIHGFRKPFYPFTCGKIIPSGTGTIVLLKTRLKFFVYVIMLMWLGFLGLFIIPAFMDGHWQSGLFMFLVFAVANGTLLWDFHTDHLQTKKILLEAIG